MEFYQQYWDKALGYEEYRDLMAKQTADGTTSGPIQNAAMSNYTALNERRMIRLDRKITLNPLVADRFAQVKQVQNWLVVTETWCGDAAQILPVLNKMAEQSAAINLRLIWRDENLALIDKHLTNGSRAIPVIIALNEDMTEVLGSWGPRPRDAQELVMNNKELLAKIEDKEERSAQYQIYQADLQKWYNADKGNATQIEVLVEVEKWQH